MQNGDGVLCACNQTATSRDIILHTAGGSFIPSRVNLRHILRHCGFARCVHHAENEIAALAQVVEMLQQGRGLCCLFRLPSVKKAENRLRHRAGYAVQQRMMLLGTGLETGFRLFGGVFACTVVRLIGDAQQVLCVVAEKAGCPAAGALDGRWQKVLQRKQLALIVCRAEHFYRRHLSVGSQIQAPLHLDG